MHRQARAWIAAHASDEPLSAVEIGSRDINGTIQDLFPNASWWGIDVVDGPNVDEVADAATWQPGEPVDLVVCCEVFEHTPSWPAIAQSMFRMLRPGGLALFTMAGPGRRPHGVGVYGPDGYYENVTPDVLDTVLHGCGFAEVTVDQRGTDVRAAARRP